MATEITMPQMGFDMTEGTIAAWLKKEGDPVAKGEPIAEIETDKTTIQIESFSSGVLRKILAQAGQKVPVGQVIGIIAAPDEPIAGAPPSASPQSASQPAPEASKSNAAPQTEPRTQPAGAAPQIVHQGRIIATPVARRLAEERGIDLRYVKGTGPDGRITKADVEAFVPSSPAPVSKPTVSPVVKAPEPVPPPAPVAQAAAPAAPSVMQPLTRMRQTIAARMVASKQQVPHFYITVAVEMDAALALRAQINESLKPEGVKVSVNDMVIRAVALALRRFPNMNAAFTAEGIQRRDYVHVANAVTVEGGLVTVTVRDADKKTLKQISQEMAALAERARSNKMQPGDTGGQTFTISNLGMYNVENFIAIVNQPDAGILAVATATPTPVVRDGEIVIRTMMNMTLSGDHRLTDGAEGAQFINEIKRLLENPWSLVL
ncbi:MAG: 2-oxo acid dehydrogenase subunit E2 [Candidatus Thermofonsia Clade 3 bacterium]|uniref:Dihydrolipoamide acetyltransferase component of pyruvate dehydrogenase complex n=1 Tax=Candidatus Thermofonsia Clade 3 bacterium TaxID=2364212 RepID=A0A2M8QFJ8_9CHLR|nr:dihydrolipoamide acetyltransferase family protein [Candidatus Roseilinea sp. NK_OTU-006]PJF48538.1 MAG: 2-oxo acid dehydrogenase subunit E2 [Candidatus Thermofonsia Clade 3 bacterium]